MPNDMTGSDGRLCNHIIRAHAASFIAKQRDIKFNYGQFYEKMVALGIKLFTDGKMIYKVEQIIQNIDIINYLTHSIPIFRNINVNTAYFQTKEFSNYLFQYYQHPDRQQSIIDANKFKNRYQNNNDVFIHVRLGDVAHLNQGFAYYDKALSIISFENGYIASDDIDSELCKTLIQKYNLIVVESDEVDTIMFGSTCKHILLTGGSFSYIIGLFGFFSDIYYLKGFDNWYPSELFFIDKWKEVSV